jgi:hypothetical protein
LNAVPDDVPDDASTTATRPHMIATLVTLGAGGAFWAVFTFVLHAKWIGVAPLA